MSEPMRFDLKHFGQISTMVMSNEGEYVFYLDYAKLQAEVERLKEGNDCLGQMHDKEMERSAYLCEEVNRITAWGRGLESDLSHARVEISLLKAEAENSKRINTELLVLSNRQASDIRRLHKAGDAMAEGLLKYIEPTDGYLTYLECRANWTAAKEGKPSV